MCAAPFFVLECVLVLLACAKEIVLCGEFVLNLSTELLCDAL
jgi:hypothetical protein